MVQIIFSIIIWFLMITELNNLLAIKFLFRRLFTENTDEYAWGIYGAVLIYIGIILKDKLLYSCNSALFITVFKVVLLTFPIFQPLQDRNFRFTGFGFAWGIVVSTV